MKSANNLVVNKTSSNIQNSGKATFKLSWKNVSIWLERKSGRNEYSRILNNVSGFIYSGTLMAIMGTRYMQFILSYSSDKSFEYFSGSGKTTLFTTLSLRTNGVITGEILLNNKPVSRHEMNDISGFLPQQELIMGNLTVTEHLQLMARLKMDPVKNNNQRRKQAIYSLLVRLGLLNCAQTKMSLLSGGEVKKLSLAEQLLTDPSILFCDEPTTALDSYSAEIVVNILKDLTKRGKAIICSIHQPASGIFDIFHQVSVLAHGKLIYFGPTENVCSYFESLHIKCPAGYNCSEYYILQLAKVEKDAIKLQNICDYFQNSTFFDPVREEFNNNNISGSIFAGRSSFSFHLSEKLNIDTHKLSKDKINFYTQLCCLLWRCMINMIRNYQATLLNFVFYMFITLLLSSTYWNVTQELDQEDIQNIEGLIFLIVTETIFTFTYSVLHTFPEELPKIIREVSDGLYKPESYYVAKVLSFIPIIMLQTFCYSLLIFWSTGLLGGITGFVSFYITVLCSALSSTAYGFALSTTFQSVATASLVSVPIDFLGMTYSGIYLNISNLPWYTAWLPKISQFYFGTTAISVTQWKKVDVIHCNNPELPCLMTGISVLEKFGMQNNNYIFCILSLLAPFFVYHLFGYVSFRCACKKTPIY